jgi:hypothetical protein
MRGAVKKIWEKFWGWLNIESNRAWLAVIGPTIAALIGGLWIFGRPKKGRGYLQTLRRPRKTKKRMPSGEAVCTRYRARDRAELGEGHVLEVCDGICVSSQGELSIAPDSSSACPNAAAHPPWHFETRPPAL